jgi:nicotinamidase-related amidase
MNPDAELIDKHDALLLLVDIQKIMLELCVMPENMVKHVVALLDLSRLTGFPVIFTEHNAEKLGGFVPHLTERVERPQIFNKLEFGCFANEAIASAVKQTGKKSIILAGIESHVCIFQTGAQAIQAGYRVHAVSDAISARSEPNRQVGLNRLRSAGAVITSTEMLLFELLGKAGTDEFRKVLPIVKSL